MDEAVIAKEEEFIALRVTYGLEGDDVAILNLAIIGGYSVEAIRDGFLAEVMDEELLLDKSRSVIR